MYTKVKDERIRGLLRYIHTNDPGEDDFSKRLSKLVENIKENEKFRDDYNAMNLHDQDIIRVTTQQTNIEAARSFYANGVSVEIIAKSLNMTEEQVLEIVKEPVSVKK